MNKIRVFFALLWFALTQHFRSKRLAKPAPSPNVWVTDATYTEIAVGLKHLEEDREYLLSLAEDYPVEVEIAGRCFLFSDEPEFDAVLDKIRVELGDDLLG